ncbi:MAG TPA: hypothetical protein VFE84_03505, partial [Patescibacteria group bacterium]|nr:hypothetical protein [Patescibacteria group bacterium]
MQQHPMADPYSVPKRESTARITLPGMSPLTVTIFLGVSAARHSGYERLSDLFNGPLRFLPARDASGRMVFIQRDAVMVVSSVGVDEASKASEAARTEGPDDQETPEDLVVEATTRTSVEVIL